MKILLLSPPYLLDYMRNARCDFVSWSSTQWYPVWLGYCGAVLEKFGHNVRIIDAPAYGLNHVDTKKQILKFCPEFLVVYSGVKSENNDIRFAEDILDILRCKVVFVGPYTSISPENILKKSEKINFAIKGEFEYPVLELIEGKKYGNIKNLLYREDNKIKINEVRPFLTTSELDNIPFVTDFFNRHLNFKYYRTISELYPFIDLMTGRGCKWGLCTYCLWVHSFITGQTYNKRTIKNVIEEFKFIKKELKNIRSVMIQDDTLPAERARELSEALLKEDIKISWSCYVRAEIDYETLKFMKKAGCRNLHVGYESANKIILKNIKKGLSTERMIQFTKDAKKVGLRIHGDFAIGFDGETKDTINETVKFAKKINPHTAQFQIMIPYEETPFYNYLKENKFLKDGVPNYPDLSNEQLKELSKKAYISFYLSLQHIIKIIKNPYEYLIKQRRAIISAIPILFLKK